MTDRFQEPKFISSGMDCNNELGVFGVQSLWEFQVAVYRECRIKSYDKKIQKTILLVKLIVYLQLRWDLDLKLTDYTVHEYIVPLFEDVTCDSRDVSSEAVPHEPQGGG